MRTLNQRRLALNTAVLAGFGIAGPIQGIQPIQYEGFTHGQVLAFNASQFAGANFHEALTAFAARQADPEAAMLEGIATYLSPEVYSGAGIAEYGTFENVDSFRASGSADGDKRAIGADFATLAQPNSSIAEQRIPNRGLAVEIDEDQMQGPGWEQEQVSYLMGILARNRIRRSVTLLTGVATAFSKTWDATAGKNPDGDLRDQLDLAAATLGFRPNRLAFDPTAASYRLSSLESQTTAAGFAGAQRDMPKLSTYLGAECREIKARYASSSSARTALLGTGKVLIFSGSETPNRNDFSNVKTFWRNTASGTRYRVIKQQVGDKRWRIAVEVYEQQAVLSSLGVRIGTISNA